LKASKIKKIRTKYKFFCIQKSPYTSSKIERYLAKSTRHALDRYVKRHHLISCNWLIKDKEYSSYAVYPEDKPYSRFHEYYYKW